MLVAALGAALPALAADFGYSETWDNQGDLAGWFPNTSNSTVANFRSGGKGGGYMVTRRAGDFPIGAATDLAAGPPAASAAGSGPRAST